MRHLIGYVVVAGEIVGPEDEPLPADIASQIGEHCWTNDDGTLPSAPPAPEGSTTGDVAPVPPPVVVPGLPPAVIPEPQPEISVPTDVIDDPDLEPEPEPEPDAPREHTGPVFTAPTGNEPPRVGRGASRSAWEEFLAGTGITITADMNRDDIIATYDATIFTS